MIFNICYESTWGEGGRAVAGAGVGAGLGPGSPGSVSTTTVSAAAAWHGAMPALNLRLTPPAPSLHCTSCWDYIDISSGNNKYLYIDIFDS